MKLLGSATIFRRGPRFDGSEFPISVGPWQSCSRDAGTALLIVRIRCRYYMLRRPTTGPAREAGPRERRPDGLSPAT